MSYQYRILNDYPLHAYPLNAGETAPADVSGNALPASMTTTPVLGPPLVMGGGNSFVVSSANKLTFGTTVFTGDVTKSFTLEAWFKPIASGTILILGHTGGRDGLIWDGESVSFVTSHGTAGESRARYYLPELSGSFHVVGVHSKGKNQLYVNRELVAESDVTDAQILAGYDNADSILNSGISYAGTPSILLDYVAVYQLALSPRQITNHFFAGRGTTDYRNVAIARGGLTWDFTDASALIGWEKTFNDDYSWNSGLSSNTNFQSGTLYPAFDDAGLTLLGYWRYGQVFTVPSPLGGSKIEWDGDGNFVVEVSLDAESTWQTCINGREIPGLTEGSIVANKDFSIRITFPAGEASDTVTKVRWLSVKLYNSRDLSQVVAGRTIDIAGNATLASDVHQPIELHDDMGLDLYNGYAIVSPDTSEVPQPVRVVEMWVRIPNLSSARYFIDFRGTGGGVAYWGWNGTAWNGGGITFVVNGVQYTTATMPIQPGQWNHIVLILGADHPGSFVLGAHNNLGAVSGIQIGSLTTYSTTMTVAQAANLYNSNIGASVSRVNDPQTVTLVDPANGIKLYQFDWTPAGV